MTSAEPGPQLICLPFPMPTTPALSLAYTQLYIAANGTPEARQALGNPIHLPRPWDPPSCTDHRIRAELWAWLDDVATWFNHEYVWDPAAGHIPACWPHHPHLAHELAVLADQRRRAAIDLTSGSLEEWHRYSVPGFLERLKTRIRNGCDDRHSPWPYEQRHTRHLRQQRDRTNTINDDLPCLTPQLAATDNVPRLRLAADAGESIDPVTGELST